MNITIDGVQYAPVPEPGSRHVVVVDRGWLFAGNMTRENGRIVLTHCVLIFRWQSCGFAAVIEDPSKADIRPFADIDIPAGSEIYSIPVSDQWGLQ
jgi:hypothetical protein